MYRQPHGARRHGHAIVRRRALLVTSPARAEPIAIDMPAACGRQGLLRPRPAVERKEQRPPCAEPPPRAATGRRLCLPARARPKARAARHSASAGTGRRSLYGLQDMPITRHARARAKLSRLQLLAQLERAAISERRRASAAPPYSASPAPLSRLDIAAFQLLLSGRHFISRARRCSAPPSAGRQLRPAAPA